MLHSRQRNEQGDGELGQVRTGVASEDPHRGLGGGGGGGCVCVQHPLLTFCTDVNNIGCDCNTLGELCGAGAFHRQHACAVGHAGDKPDTGS